MMWRSLRTDLTKSYTAPPIIHAPLLTFDTRRSQYLGDRRDTKDRLSAKFKLTVSPNGQLAQ